MRYAVVIHKDVESVYGVAVPDLPGCFSAGDTLEGSRRICSRGDRRHLEGLLMDGESIPARNRSKHTKRARITRGASGRLRMSMSPSCRARRADQHHGAGPRSGNRGRSSGAGRPTRSGLLARAALSYIERQPTAQREFGLSGSDD